MAGSGEGKSALDVELKAIGLALDWAVEMNWRTFTVFSDCKTDVDALQQRKVPDWRVVISFYNVMEKLKMFEFCNLKFVKRNCIAFVNDLAVQARVLRLVDYRCNGEGLPPINPTLF
ncbi:hypothetical protein G4B88_016971 [Cannabis sativa]|uniref:RNase H type-1 domain-containing protein n=1 Tax=Cannabis sativa TaxID=3483 RepID=A0A7J6FMN7_CANSA|nr:hypothetical protein G4B88_016971 [Cannabis sativa]